MLTVNLSVDEGLVNGSRGVVVDIVNEGVIVKFIKCTRLIKKHNFTIPLESEDGEKKKRYICRSQFPLILAWSTSIHRCQGSTLDRAIVDLGDSIFSAGMAYVCLSRVRTLDGLIITKFNPERVYADEEVIEFDKKLLEGIS
jgi:ATP-dependent DNA helicase PIF1